MIIMYSDCDIDKKSQVLKKIDETEKCVTRLSDEDIECMKESGEIDNDAYLVIKILKNKNNMKEEQK